MLKHEQPEGRVEEQPAAQVRVTPEELATAIARLEARRAGADGKIAIGDAVTELSLDATPEEVLAEVRAGQSQPQAGKPKRLSLRERAGLVLAGGAVLLALTGWFQSSVRPASGPAAAPFVGSSSAAEADRHISLDPNLLVGDRTGKLVLLSEVGDNQPVHSNYSGGGFQQYSPGHGTKWTLIKHGGKVYVRGWIRKMSPAALAQDGADVSVTDSRNFAVPVTFAVKGITVSSWDPSYQFPDGAIHAQKITPDSHSYEKW